MSAITVEMLDRPVRLRDARVPASGLAAPGEDVRDVVAELVDLNGLAGAQLRAGQQILLPADR